MTHHTETTQLRFVERWTAVEVLLVVPIRVELDRLGEIGHGEP